ncbi:MAG: DUF2634 domain-containing protein [Peptococcaceae bacterium]
MPNIYPVFSAPELAAREANLQTVRYGKSFHFDFAKGDFTLEGDGKVSETDGYQAWVQWCLKAVLTRRFTYLAYSGQFGMERDGIRRIPARNGVQAELARVITEALLADPRTEAVTDFAYDWQGDGVRVGFTVKPVIGTRERLEVSIND